jgi:hypothetical protein
LSRKFSFLGTPLWKIEPANVYVYVASYARILSRGNLG